MKRMNRIQFAIATGHLPVEDDLERTNCKLAGLPGHMWCGVCPEHRQPRMFCGCRNLSRIMESIEDATLPTL